MVWVLLLLGAVVSPLVVLFQLVFWQGHWRLGLFAFLVLPAVVVLVLFLVLLSNMRFPVQ